MKLAALNAASRESARSALTACCGSHRWVDRMIERRPFASPEALFAAADDIWSSLGREDWLEAFAHHPRIGESKAAVAQDSRARGWSAAEQGDSSRGDTAVRAEQQRLNAEYEQRFGYIYIVCATGKSPTEMVSIARRRLANTPDQELGVAAEEQRKITRLRLEKLLNDSSS
ncbi:MAG TPA: 2-oxo-4-hydroxy-4-carboxy-5-ureidoimidazoline decarboxylase [Gemmatimonadaceae bacterium]